MFQMVDLCQAFASFLSIGNYQQVNNYIQKIYILVIGCIICSKSMFLIFFMLFWFNDFCSFLVSGHVNCIFSGVYWFYLVENQYFKLLY